MADALKNMLDCRAFRYPAYTLFVISGIFLVGGLLDVVAFQPGMESIYIIFKIRLICKRNKIMIVYSI